MAKTEQKEKMTKVIVAVIGAGILYFLYKKITEEQDLGDEDLLQQQEVPTGGIIQTDPMMDNPSAGTTYQGDKPRSQGNSQTITTTAQTRDGFSLCVPAMDSEGGGKGKYISVDDPHTPAQVEADRRQIIHDNLQVGHTIDLDGRPCKIKKFWADSAGRNSAINCEDHNNITYTANSSICW